MKRTKVPASRQQMHDILAHWRALHTGLERSLRTLPESAFSFRPKPRMHTLADLIRHTLRAESYYFCNMLERRKPPWALPRTLRTRKQVMEAIRHIHRHSREYMRGLRDEDLTREVGFPGGPKMTVRHLLLYAIAHEAHHRAQIYTYIRMWEPAGRKYPRPWYPVRGYPAME